MKLFFCHIPKNAGTSVALHIASQLPEAQVHGIDNEITTVPDFLAHQDAIIERSDFISGHIPLPMLEASLDRFDAIIAVVRSPLDRLISMYKYQIAKGHFAPEGSLQDFLQHHYLSNNDTRNEQCGYLGYFNRFQSVIDRLESTPNLHVVRYEALDQLGPILAGFSLTLDGLPSLNAGSANSQEIVKEISTELYRQVFDWFDDDFLLYDYLRCRDRQG